MNDKETSPSRLERVANAVFIIVAALVVTVGIVWLIAANLQLQIVLILGVLVLILEIVAVGLILKHGVPRVCSPRALGFYLWVLLTVAALAMIAVHLESRTAVILSVLALAVQLVIAVLSWRRWRGLFSRKRLRFAFWFFAGAVSLIVLVHVEENWRGRRAWAALQREAASRGESLELSSLTLPPVPDDQNFAAAPGIPALLAFLPPVPVPATNATGQEPFLLAQFRWDKSRLPRAYWGQFTDLSAWQKYFRARDETTSPALADFWQPLFPRTKEPQSPAADVLLALSGFEPDLELLRAAGRRPSTRFPFDYRDGWWGIRRECFNRLRDAAQILSLRAVAQLSLNQTDAAFQDTLLALRLTRVLRQEPFATLPRGDMFLYCMQPIWEGMVKHRWTEPQLAGLQESLANTGALADWERYQRGETLAMMHIFDEFQVFANGQPSQFENASKNPFLHFAVWLAKTAYPAGWFYQDKVHVYRFMQQYSDAVKTGTCLSPADKRLGPLRITDPFFCLFMLPKVRQIGEESMAGAFFYQTACFTAQAACALERYRIAHGQYPESWDALVPDYLKQIPSGIRYRTNNGGYAISWNGMRPDPSWMGWQWQQGDWTWGVPGPR